MGGYGSGRRAADLTVEQALTLDLRLLIRRGWICDGAIGSGQFDWARDGEPWGSIAYSCDLARPDAACMTLRYTWMPTGGEPRHIEQFIQLTWTQPRYGGRRWWFICPVSGRRSSQLYLDATNGIFVNRIAARLSYRSQRTARRDRPFARLFRLQEKLGGDVGWEAGLFRPKGMHRRTFERHLDRYLLLEAECEKQMSQLLQQLPDRIFPLPH